MENIISLDQGFYLKDLQAMVLTDSSSREVFTSPIDAHTIGKVKIAPWGASNNLPEEILLKVRKAEVVQSNLLLNILMSSAQGIKPMKKTMDDAGKITYSDLRPEDKDHKKILDFWENNDIDGFFLEQITDMHAFFNVFPEIILNSTGTKVLRLTHKEATFSRWGSMLATEKRIMRHYYCGDWSTATNENDLEMTPVLDRYYTVDNLSKMVKAKKSNRRFIIPVSFPTPGREYYQYPYWWSIFESGWYDYLIMIPEVKKALLKNQLGIRYLVYVSPEYWDVRARSEGVDTSDPKKMKTFQTAEVGRIQDFVAGKENAGKGLITPKEMKQSGSGAIEEKFIEIVPIPSLVKDGEFMTDSEEVTNIINYAMQVNGSLANSTPGKNSGSLGGSEKRELFDIKVSMLTPFVSRLLKPLKVIKAFNKWPDDIVFINPQTVFTTLDVTKSGKQTSESE